MKKWIVSGKKEDHRTDDCRRQETSLDPSHTQSSPAAWKMRKMRFDFREGVKRNSFTKDGLCIEIQGFPHNRCRCNLSLTPNIIRSTHCRKRASRTWGPDTMGLFPHVWFLVCVEPATTFLPSLDRSGRTQTRCR